MPDITPRAPAAVLAASPRITRGELTHAQALLALLVVEAMVLVAYAPTAAAMVSIWSRSETFAHAFLVPPIVVWLIWRQRGALAESEPRPCAWILLPMAAMAFAW